MNVSLWSDYEPATILDMLHELVHQAAAQDCVVLFFCVTKAGMHELIAVNDREARFAGIPVFVTGDPPPDTAADGGYPVFTASTKVDSTKKDAQKALDTAMSMVLPEFAGERVKSMTVGFAKSMAGNRVPVLRKFTIESGDEVYLDFHEHEFEEFQERNTITDAPDPTEN